MAEGFDYSQLEFSDEDIVFWSNIEESIDTDFWGKNMFFFGKYRFRFSSEFIQNEAIMIDSYSQ